MTLGTRNRALTVTLVVSRQFLVIPKVWTVVCVPVANASPDEKPFSWPLLSHMCDTRITVIPSILHPSIPNRFGALACFLSLSLRVVKWSLQ